MASSDPALAPAQPAALVLGMHAEALTAIGTILLAAVTAVLAVATIALAFAAVKQLPLLAKQIRAATKQRVEDNTLDMIQHQNLNPVVVAASRRIWDSSNQGQTYDKSKVDEHDLRIVANYLNVVAIGVSQGVYSKSIVRDHMEATITKVVDIVIPAIFGNHEGYERLEALRNSWKPAPTPPEHRSDVGYP